MSLDPREPLSSAGVWAGTARGARDNAKSDASKRFQLMLFDLKLLNRHAGRDGAPPKRPLPSGLRALDVSVHSLNEPPSFLQPR
jgi:hypothetical protein